MMVLNLLFPVHKSHRRSLTLTWWSCHIQFYKNIPSKIDALFLSDLTLQYLCSLCNTTQLGLFSTHAQSLLTCLSHCVPCFFSPLVNYPFIVFTFFFSSLSVSQFSFIFSLFTRPLYIPYFSLHFLSPFCFVVCFIRPPHSFYLIHSPSLPWQSLPASHKQVKSHTADSACCWLSVSGGGDRRTCCVEVASIPFMRLSGWSPSRCWPGYIAPTGRTGGATWWCLSSMS